ncbi:MAG: PilZ domain-containing protein [Pyrinomonadaceae bacterium]
MMSSLTTESESRRIQRISLTLPIRVESHINESTSWNEVTRLNDVSAFGAGFNLHRPVKRGRLLQMTIPMPRKLRSYDFTEPQYKVWGLVRSCITKRNSSAPETYAIGTAFIGKHPPKNYYDDPAMLFDISHRNDGSLWQVINAQSKPDESTLPKELRRHSRYSIPANIIVEIIDVDGNITASEPTVTENLSLSGAALFTTLAVEVGSFVRVKSDQYNVSIISVVRGRRIGQDGVPRLHVEFVDRFFPLEGIE